MIPAAHLNETLKRMLPVMAKTNAARLAHALQTPYLTFADTAHKGVTGEELRSIGMLDDFGLPRTPFPVFRFCLEDSKRRVVFGCVQRQEGNLQLVAFHRYDGKTGPVSWAITFKRWDPNGDMDFDGRMFDTRTLKDITDFVKQTDERRKPLRTIESVKTPQEAREILPQWEQRISAMQKSVDIMKSEVGMLETVGDATTGADFGDVPSPFLALYHSVMILCYEYLTPANFIARVIPSTQGKSVEWLKAREHYTVIHRHHAANNATVKEGQTVAHDPNHSTRLAHSRRAHTKLLTHARYTFKRGQRVFVRASWVGPKEWKDTAGQTYQILTPTA